MSKLFISANDEIKIKCVIANRKNGDLVADISVKMLKESFENIDESTIEEYDFVFRRPAFGDLVHMNSTLTTNDGFTATFNPLAIRMGRMTSLIKSWSLTDAEGDTIPPNEEAIASLNPVIANTVGLQLDAAIGGIA